MQLDDEARYRAVHSRDRRFDGVFYTCVASTGIYCRPSCPAITPKRRNVSFTPTAAAAQAAGFRACKRCLPDATPGSPDWDVTADAAGRAMRLIGDGVVERDGVEGLAARLGYSSRQLHRIMTSQYGAAPLALARSHRAQIARVLVETTAMPLSDVAFAAGFNSIRQFNDTMREVYAATPSELRGRKKQGSAGSITTRIAIRTPFAARELLDFLCVRAVPGVEVAGDDFYERSLRLPHGPGVVRVQFADDVTATFTLTDARDLSAALERTRRLLDADADPVAIDEALANAGLTVYVPGLRVPGHVDGTEIAVRAILGQQVSVERARTLAGQLVAEHGEQIDLGADVTHLFPSAETLADVDPETIPMPRARGRAINAVCRAIADGDVVLDRSGERGAVRESLLALPGIGPWTADYIAMRALGDPDVFLPTDVGVRHGLDALGLGDSDAEAWRPWRSYALMHLWLAASNDTATTRPRHTHRETYSERHVDHARFADR